MRDRFRDIIMASSIETDTMMNRAQNIDTLVSDVEELLAALSDYQQPAIQELCGRVENAIDSTKHAGTSAVARIGRYAAALDNYIAGYPRLGFLTGVIVGGLIVYAAGLFGSER
jgi:hypothetical protein